MRWRRWARAQVRRFKTKHKQKESEAEMNIRTLILLVLAAALEVGGDALIRSGLQRKGGLLLLAGAATLVVYGFMVNMTKLDFSRLMGLYIIIFFFVAQAVAVLIFHEAIEVSVIAGGGLVLVGGLVMTFYRG
jgi:small multidrug resistance family-3 protein